MAKNTQNNGTDVSAVLEKLQANSVRKGGQRIKKRKYTVGVPENLDSIRMAPQAITVVGEILSTGKTEITEAEICGTLNAATTAGKFTGKQSGWKVYQFYRKPIIEAGFLTEIKDA